MRAKPIPFDEQLTLIMECRQSGLSDYQWCQEHDINPGTFYNWVKRHRQKACSQIPESSARKEEPVPVPRQEVIRVEPGQLPTDQPDHPAPAGLLHHATPETSPGVLEVELNGAVLRATNEVCPGLLAQAIRILRGMPC